MSEQTLVIIKPDGINRRLVGEILQRFERADLAIVRLEMKSLSAEQLREHYQHLLERPFFPELFAYMTEGPVVLLVLEGEQAITRVRKLVGATDPLKAEMGTIRAELGLNTTRNIVHASDSEAAATAEIARFFG